MVHFNGFTTSTKVILEKKGEKKKNRRKNKFHFKHEKYLTCSNIQLAGEFLHFWIFLFKRNNRKNKVIIQSKK